MAKPGRFRRDDMDYMDDLSAAMVAHQTPAASLTLWLLAAVLIVGLLWAALSELEEITAGQGRVIASSRVQVIQNLEGGILEELAVKEGDVVDKGQILLRIDDTRASAFYREGISKILALKGTAARVRAEAQGGALAFPPDVHERPEIVRTESEAYRTRRQAVEESVATLKRSLELAEKEIAMTEPLSQKGLVSETEVLKLKRQANDLRLQIAERFNKYRADANAELGRVESDLAQAGENVVGRQDTVSRTVIRSPMRGTVKNVRITTIGGVIQPGTDIMEIVPLEDQLLIEARIKPADVAFLRPGLAATVKISAYDYGIYGGLSGTVEHISPDTLNDDKRPAPTPEDNAYYRVIVRTETSALKKGDKVLPIIPGMTASVEILTGHKSVLDYLLKPVFKAREAMREK